MNGKSVKMSPAKTSCMSTRLWNEADLGLASDDPAVQDRDVVDDLALRGLGPAGRAATDRLAGDPGQIGGPFGQIFCGLPDQAESLVHLLPPDPQAGQRVTGDVRGGGRHGQRSGTRRRGG